MAKSKQAAKKENLDDLKQELDIDYHKITSEELYQRFQTHPENVSSSSMEVAPSIPLKTDTMFFDLFAQTGSKPRQGQRKLRTRWTKCANTAENNTRMG